MVIIDLTAANGDRIADIKRIARPDCASIERAGYSQRLEDRPEFEHSPARPIQQRRIFAVELCRLVRIERWPTGHAKHFA